MLMEAKADIVSFDAYEFMDKYLMYWREIKVLLDRGGYLAWGIVPTSLKITSVSSNDLVEKIGGRVSNFSLVRGYPEH